VSAALDQVGEAGDSIRTNLDEEVDELRNLFFSAIRGGLVELHLFPPRLTTVLSERPRASRLARQEAETSTLVTNLRHGTVKLEDPAVRRFLRLVDGTRTVEQLVSDLRAELQRGDFVQSIEITGEAVERNLTQLARLGLLEA
jgi:hypothetical protein